MRKSIAFVIAVLTVIALNAGTANAGCGKKVATIGELESYDAGTNAVIIKVTQTSDKSQQGKSVKLTITPSSKTMGGKAVDELVGSRLSVVSEHDEVDLLIPLLAAN
jgi:hypothetical protein